MEFGKFRPYLAERQPLPEDYRGVARIEWVHMGFDPDNVVTPREKLIINRIVELGSKGVNVIEVDELFDQSLPIKGEIIVIGGAVNDACCEIRRAFISEHGGKAFIDMALTF